MQPGNRKEDEPFDPLMYSMDVGQLPYVQRKKAEREQRIAAAMALRAHLQLDDPAAPWSQSGEGKSVAEREKYAQRLTGFPEIPEHERHELERIIATYGMPLMSLSSDIAAYVYRRVTFEMGRISRTSASLNQTDSPLFTQAEMLELMRVLEVTPGELARLLGGDSQDNLNANRGNVYRWLHGVNQPRGMSAMRLNAMIERYVRKRKEPILRPMGRVRRNASKDYSKRYAGAAVTRDLEEPVAKDDGSGAAPPATGTTRRTRRGGRRRATVRGLPDAAGGTDRDGQALHQAGPGEPPD